MSRLSIAVVAICVLIAATVACAQPTTQEQPETTGTYVGTAVCRGCHRQVYEEWLLTPHRRTLFNTKNGPAWRGCEGCHGPGGPHVAAGGGPGSIVNLAALSPERTSEICLKCHNQKNVMLWKSSAHAISKLACNNCHDPHLPDRATMLKLIDSARHSVQGLNSAISDARLAANEAADKELRQQYLTKIDALQNKKAALEHTSVDYESKLRRTNQAYLCLTCHKQVEMQFKLPSHHPLYEEKIVCSDCHNPHGGRLQMLKEERKPETCYRCHAEVQGPFVFQHPPVNEDCTLCHKPHGAQYNNLLAQQDPFICLKCHAGPHSRSNQFLSEKRISDYYWRCTGCHFPHGSDRHASFHM